MKRLAKIVNVVVLVLLFIPAVAFADEPVKVDSTTNLSGQLKIIEQYPEPDSKTSPPTNPGMKLYFNKDFADKNLQKSNAKKFELLGPQKKAFPLEILYSEKEPNYILVVPKPDNREKRLGKNSKYTLRIEGSLQADDGSTLGEDYITSFQTRDPGSDTKVNMIMMGVMFVFVIGFTSLQARKNAKKAAEGASKNKQEKFNPYKVAKEKGKSVEEVMEEYRRKEARRNRKESASSKADVEEDTAENIYKVTGPKPIALAGGKYKNVKKPPAPKKPDQKNKQNKKKQNKNKKKK